MTNRIDHFVIGAQSLEQGVDHLRTALGVTVPRGSKHTTMGTHNCVMQGGNESFLEILAIDPEGVDPGRPRWFSMDDPRTQARIAQRPRPLCWVVGTDDLDALVASSPVDLGEIVHFQRGDRTWRITIQADGHLPEAGLLPAFIQWSPGPHPSTNHQDLGVRLQRIILTTPTPASLSRQLEALRIDHLAEVRQGATGIAFEMATPLGTVTLE